MLDFLNNKPIRKPFRYCFKNFTLILILINCAVFAFTSFFPNSQIYLGFCPELFIKYKMYWQCFTYMFTHANLSHLFSNMIGLLFFGWSLEKAIGSKEFLIIYILCGIVSGFCSFFFNLITSSVSSILIGASGALYAILFVFAVVFPKAKIFIWGILPVPSPLLILIYTIIELFSQVTGIRGNVAHYAHLFGFLAAFLYIIIRMGINPLKVWKNAYRQ